MARVLTVTMRAIELRTFSTRALATPVFLTRQSTHSGPVFIASTTRSGSLWGEVAVIAHTSSQAPRLRYRPTLTATPAPRVSDSR